MSKTGPIVIIDDDQDDQEMIQRVISKMRLDNEVRMFSDGEEALHYFQHHREQPLLTICDINMPLMNGIELKEHLNFSEYLKRKSSPFVFLTTSANLEQIKKAYSLNAQGFFLKGQSYEELKEVLIHIISYWKNSFHPNH